MRVRVEARTGAVRDVRHLVARWARENGAADGAERTLTLLTSEVVTNAVEHGPEDGVVIVDIDRDGTGFRVTVTDQSPQQPVVRPPSPAQIRGRGMQLVSLLASDWGIDPDAGGKSVWFVVAE